MPPPRIHSKAGNASRPRNYSKVSSANRTIHWYQRRQPPPKSPGPKQPYSLPAGERRRGAVLPFSSINGPLPGGERWRGAVLLFPSTTYPLPAGERRRGAVLPFYLFTFLPLKAPFYLFTFKMNLNTRSLYSTLYSGSARPFLLQLSTPPTPACARSMQRLV